MCFILVIGFWTAGVSEFCYVSESSIPYNLAEVADICHRFCYN